MAKSNAETWCAYVASIIETYLRQNPPAEAREKAIAGIILRRLSFLGPKLKITTPEQYAEVLAEAINLACHEPEINTPEADRLNELTEALLVYEGVNFKL
jgi:hypothetical protein